MLAQDQREQARKLFAYLDTQTTAIADHGLPPTRSADYTCRKQFACEREHFFRRGPLLRRSELPLAAGWATRHGPMTMPACRCCWCATEDGTLRAFLNVCRHRGARVEDGSGHAAKDFACPYHAWSVRDRRPADCAGLTSARSPRSTRRARSLRELPVAEKYGMIYVSPTPGTGIAVDAMLSGAAARPWRPISSTPITTTRPGCSTRRSTGRSSSTRSSRPITCSFCTGRQSIRSSIRT